MSDVQNLIIETATKLFEKHCTPETLRQFEQGVWPAELWTLVEQTGLNLASLPESVGGAGGSLSDAVAVLRVAGQYGVPLPLAETYLSGWLLAAAGQSLPDGPLTVAFSQAETAPHFSPGAEGWLTNGTFRQVPWAWQAHQIL